MRSALLALVGAAVVAAVPVSAFALPSYPIAPTTAQIAAARAADHDHPCHVISNDPHESPALQAMQERCRRLRMQVRTNPDDAALGEACDHAARALAGQPC